MPKHVAEKVKSALESSEAWQLLQFRLWRDPVVRSTESRLIIYPGTARTTSVPLRIGTPNVWRVIGR